MKPGYTIRLCQTLEEYRACIEMQRTVWQFSDLDIIPLRSFVITRKSGGFTLGAFDEGDRLLGFTHAVAAFDARKQPYYYSHMLAVDPTLQNSGIGGRLKLAQRDYALAHEIRVVGWTFDPLQSRNAYLNLVKLGGVVRRYYQNYYGNASTSVLHRGLDTDRLFVEWWVGSSHVRMTLSGKPRDDEPVAVVDVPREIEELKVRDLAEAQRRQQQVREDFLGLLQSGLYCAGFRASQEDLDSRYLFFKDEHEEGRLSYE